MRATVICATAAAMSAADAPALMPAALQILPTGTIKPAGWLRAELELQADGLGGHLQDFWAPLQQSEWLGGDNTFEDWIEIAPYVFDGFSGLAVLLNDSRPELLVQMGAWLDTVLNSTNAEGWFGPTPQPNSDMVYWCRWPVLKAMLQYMEGTGDARMLPAIMGWQRAAASWLPTSPLGYTWQGVRWQDWVQINEYLIDQGYATGPDATFLLNLTQTIYTQALAAGVDWENKWYVDGWFPTGPITGGFNLTTHGVNNAQALKSGAVYYRFTGDESGIASSYKRMQLLDTYHGVPSGVFQADEHLAGNMPSHGTETCAVVEMIYSWNIVHETIGDATFADKAEHILYNALPAALTKNFTARVYLQSSNEIAAVVQNPHIWYDDGPDAIIYSLEGNYACCTANFHQGWPKAVQHAIHTTAAGAIAISLYGPVVATLPSGVTVTVNTDYPFDDNILVALAGLQVGATQTLLLRIPSWATTATLSIGGGAPFPVGDAANTMFAVNVTGDASGAATVTLFTNPVIRLSGPWFNGAYAVHRGPLLYTLQLQEVFATTAVYSNVSSDYAITMPPTPSTPWNIALVTNVTDPDQSKYFTFSRTGPIPAVPFSSYDIPMTITATARQVNSWGTTMGQPNAPPTSPVDCSAAGACGSEITVTLIPFGSTHLRLTELPVVLPSQQ